MSPVIQDGSANYTTGISERRGSTTLTFNSGLKDADAQSNTSQMVANSRVYDAFGNITAATGTWKGPFGYAGGFGYQEDASGLQLLGHRYYDPSIGRFLTRDAIKDGRNWYGYCGNEPVSQSDPTGHDFHDPGIVYNHSKYPVFVFGDFDSNHDNVPGNDNGQYGVWVRPGHRSPEYMDVDFVMAPGSDYRSFLHGKNIHISIDDSGGTVISGHPWFWPWKEPWLLVSYHHLLDNRDILFGRDPKNPPGGGAR